MRHFRFGIISILLILIIVSSSIAQSKQFSLSFKPYIGFNSGKTEYIMELKDIMGNFLKSQLEFPLDQTMVGGEIDLKILPGTNSEIGFTIGYYTNLNDPSGKMYDHDWWNFRTGSIEKFSYTESDVEGTNNIMLVEVDKLVLLNENGSLSLTGGFKYQKIEQEIFGINGWQLDPDNDWEPFEFNLPDINALYYEITYKLPNIGFRVDYNIVQALSLQSRIAYTRAFITDYDNHKLRFKQTDADITGNGVLADFTVHWNFESMPLKGLFVELSGDVTSIKATGKSTQSWYGDDPVEDGDETDQVFDGIPHEINTTQYRFGIAVGMGL